MNAKIIFNKILNFLCILMLGISTASACGMANEEMPEELKALR